MESVKIRYLKDVQSPPDQVGTAGEEKEVSVFAARQLVNGGFAEIVKKKNRTTNGHE